MIVEWYDSRQPTSNWKRISDVTGPMPVLCVSVGWLLFDEKDCEVLCANMGDVESDDPQGSGIIEIPSTCIKSVKRLSEPLIFSGDP